MRAGYKDFNYVQVHALDARPIEIRGNDYRTLEEARAVLRDLADAIAYLEQYRANLAGK